MFCFHSDDESDSDAEEEQEKTVSHTNTLRSLGSTIS